jgi:hypothetical protein
VNPKYEMLTPKRSDIAHSNISISTQSAEECGSCSACSVVKYGADISVIKLRGLEFRLCHDCKRELLHELKEY